MGRQMVVQVSGREFIPLRYDNFAALGAEVDPPRPTVFVPFHRSVDEVAEEARALADAADDQLLAQGVGGLSGDPDELTYEDRLSFPFLLFRGERDKRFGVMPTRYRFSGEPDPLHTTKERIAFERRCADVLLPYLRAHGDADAPADTARAAARHYGAPSSFVDFSFEPEVALAFAHPAPRPAERGQGPIGILYALSFDLLQGLFGLQAWGLAEGGGRDIHCVNVSTVWQVPYLELDAEGDEVRQASLAIRVPESLVVRPFTIRTRAIPAVARVAAQRGVFLEANFEQPEDWWSQVFLWTVLDFAARKWCFIRRDHAFEDPTRGVTARELFPPDPPEVAKLTAGFGDWP